MLHPGCDPALNTNQNPPSMLHHATVGTAYAMRQQGPISTTSAINSIDLDGPSHSQIPSPFDPMLQQQTTAFVHHSHHYPGSSAGSSAQHRRLPSANEPCQEIAHVLQCYQQGGEQEDFVRKAIESLVKKLKDKRPELDALITAVTTSGKAPTDCVTIQKSLDGRLQVAGRKGVPHVVYAKIWRWPNVNKNELQKLPICKVSHDDKDLICVNPYHYERVVSPGIGNIDMSSLKIDAIPCQQQPQQQLQEHQQQQHVQSPQQFVSSMPLASSLSMKSDMSDFPSPHQQQVLHQQHQPQQQQQLQQQQHQMWSPCSVVTTTHQGGGENFCGTSQQHVQNFVPSAQLTSNESSSMHLQQQPRPSRKFDFTNIVLPQNLQPPDHWCTISYYEFDTQIGENFKVRRGQTEINIDGGMDPAGAKFGRFCLGALPNVHRTDAAENARLHIGKGIRLKIVGDGDVYLECLSNKAIFVRSYFLDFDNDRSYGTVVHKFAPGTEMIKIFDLRWSYAEMLRQSQSAHMAVLAQARAVAGIVHPIGAPVQLLSEHAGTGVDDLRRVCCTVAISFVKGWGSGYNRSAIKETPCWIEVQLHKALQLLDQVLHTMPGNVD